MLSVRPPSQAVRKPCWHARNSMVRTPGTSPVCLVHLVSLVYLVALVCLVQPNKPDKPERPDRPLFSILPARLGEIIEMGQRVAKGTTHGRRQPLAAFHSKHSLRLSSCFPVFHIPPRTEYRAKDNAQQFQDVSAPGTQNIAQTSTYILKQYDTQGDNGGG